MLYLADEYVGIDVFKRSKQLYKFDIDILKSDISVAAIVRQHIVTYFNRYYNYCFLTTMDCVGLVG